MVVKQLSLPLRRRGGRRRGAGRPRKAKTAMVSHRKRPAFEKVTPAHVTLRIAGDIPSLRSSRRFAMIKSCFAEAKQKPGLRLIEFTVLSNHLHLIVEADSSLALSRRMQGLCTRLAKALNAALKRAGRVFGDHFHSVLLRSPSQLVNAIGYVLGNAERHYGESGVDPFSSQTAQAGTLLQQPQGWLLQSGWLRAPHALLARLSRWTKYRPARGHVPA
jgi:putative transposase